jgi:hypothetical protein
MTNWCWGDLESEEQPMKRRRTDRSRKKRIISGFYSIPRAIGNKGILGIGHGAAIEAGFYLISQKIDDPVAGAVPEEHEL